MRRRHGSRLLLIGVLACAALGCDPQKASTLRTAAVQFEIEAQTALSALEHMRQRELEPPPRSAFEGADSFVSAVLDTRRPITAERVERWLDPFRTPAPPAESDLFQELRASYTAFAAIFDEVERASFLGRDVVADAQGPASKLTAQLVGFARAVETDPPRLLQHRADVVARLQLTKEDTALDGASQRRQIAALMAEYQEVLETERALARDTIEHCLRAAVLGDEVRRLIEHHREISLADLNRAVNDALELAGTLGGRDLSELSSRSALVFESIRQSPALTEVAEGSLRRLSQRARPGADAPTPDAAPGG